MIPRYPEVDGKSKAYLEMAKNIIEASDPYLAKKLGENLAYLANAVKSKRIIDLACGLSPISKVLYDELGRETEIVGADSDSDILKAAREYCGRPEVNFIEFDIENPHDIGKFGLVYFSHSLHHFDDTDGTLRTIYDILEDPGILYLTDLTRALPVYLPEHLIEKYIEVRKEMIREGVRGELLAEILGSEESEIDDNVLISIDSYLAAYTREEILDALHNANFNNVKEKLIVSDDYKNIAVCAAKDTDDKVHIEKTPEFYSIYVKQDSGLFIPE